MQIPANWLDETKFGAAVNKNFQLILFYDAVEISPNYLCNWPSRMKHFSYKLCSAHLKQQTYMWCVLNQDL